MSKKPPVNTEELEQIKALRASGLTYHAVAKRIGRDSKTVKKACLQPKTARDIEAMAERLAGQSRFLNRANAAVNGRRE